MYKSQKADSIKCVIITHLNAFTRRVVSKA